MDGVAAASKLIEGDKDFDCNDNKMLAMEERKEDDDGVENGAGVNKVVVASLFDDE